MNHKWKYFSRKSVKGEIDRRRCIQCFMEVRRIRRGSTKPHGGWIETHWREGKVGMWQTQVHSKLPTCEACRDCPTCKGTGRITRKEYLEMKHDD